MPEHPAGPILVPDPPPVEPGEREDVRRLREGLEIAVRSKVMSATELIRALAKQRRDDLLPTTLEPLDALLGGGLPRGKIVELSGRRSAGRFSIVLSALAAATSAGEAAVLVDLGDHLDPQILEANGADLRRLLWIRPQKMKDAVHAVEMIAATGFQLVILDAGLHPIRGKRVPEAAWVRLARTAEAHGTAMLISTPYPMTGTASEIVLNAQRTRPKWTGSGKSPRVLAGMTVDLSVEKHRHEKEGRSARLEFVTLEAASSTGAGVILSRADGEGPVASGDARAAAGPSASAPLRMTRGAKGASR
ncbi:MAG TPA: hypothetical protein VJ901_07780 [Thermoanaerobaculia bacterium]|nr:hypothetical protein [Thermoanaerobaculia bacterium]